MQENEGLISDITFRSQNKMKITLILSNYSIMPITIISSTDENFLCVRKKAIWSHVVRHPYFLGMKIITIHMILFVEYVFI